MILSHLVATLSALVHSLRFAGALAISRAERIRYLKKSIRLGLCYAGFGTPWNLRAAWKAGEAAFLSCAYDIVTDWRDFDEKARAAFDGVLNELAGTELREMALTLYESDINSRLSHDGLERGAVALKFILRMMGCEKQREGAWGNLTDLGELLQIVDDIYDYEDDLAAHEQNCLITPNRETYLRRLLEDLSHEQTRRFFGRGPSVLVLAIDYARKKARRLLAKSTP